MQKGYFQLLCLISGWQGFKHSQIGYFTNKTWILVGCSFVLKLNCCTQQKKINLVNLSCLNIHPFSVNYRICALSIDLVFTGQPSSRPMVPFIARHSKYYSRSTIHQRSNKVFIGKVISSVKQTISVVHIRLYPLHLIVSVVFHAKIHGNPDYPLVN